MLAMVLTSAPGPVFLAGDDLAAQVTSKCDAGCMVLSPQEAQAMIDRVNELMRQTATGAFAAGRRYEKESCRNAI